MNPLDLAFHMIAVAVNEIKRHEPDSFTALAFKATYVASYSPCQPTPIGQLLDPDVIVAMTKRFEDVKEIFQQLSTEQNEQLREHDPGLPPATSSVNTPSVTSQSGLCHIEDSRPVTPAQRTQYCIDFYEKSAAACQAQTEGAHSVGLDELADAT